jgi:hypothetical protein
MQTISNLRSDLDLIRTSRKRNSYQTEFNSYLVEFCLNLIRTSRNSNACGIGQINQLSCNYDDLIKNSHRLNAFETIRTSRKSNSYLVEFKSYLTEFCLILIRTTRNSAACVKGISHRLSHKRTDFIKRSLRLNAFQTIRTPRKRNSYLTEFKSYLTEFCLILIRTSRNSAACCIGKNHQLTRKFADLIKNSPRMNAFETIRTRRKSISYLVERKSYLTEILRRLIRTPRKLIRTSWKRRLDIATESTLFGLCIYTSLYINKNFKINKARNAYAR